MSEPSKEAMAAARKIVWIETTHSNRYRVVFLGTVVGISCDTEEQAERGAAIYQAHISQVFDAHTATLRAEALRARVAELEEAQRWRNIEAEPTFPEVGRLLEGYSDYYTEIAIYRRMRKIECHYCGAWAYEDDEDDNAPLEHDDGCKMLDQGEDWEWQRWYGHMDGLHTATRDDGRWSQSTEPDAWRYFEPAAFVQRIASE